MLMMSSAVRHTFYSSAEEDDIIVSTSSQAGVLGQFAASLSAVDGVSLAEGKRFLQRECWVSLLLRSLLWTVLVWQKERGS